MKGRFALVIVLLSVPFLACAGEALILEQAGSVTVVPADSQQAAPAITGQPLHPGDEVNTGSDGTVVILLSDGSRIDLFPNSRLQISEGEAASDSGGGFFRRLWRSITGKFADSEYASAQAGGVGAFRAAAEDEEMFDDYASEADLDELHTLLEAIQTEELPESIAALMRAIVFEDFGQFIPAEVIYLERIEGFPDDPVTYDMLFDMYLKMELYGHAASIVEQKGATLSGQESQ